MQDQVEEHMDIETLLYRKYQGRLAQIDRKLEEVKELATPISEKEFLSMIKNELPDMTESNLREHVRKRFQEASTNGKQLSKWDVYHSKIQLEINDGNKDEGYWKWAVSTQEMRDRGETYILPGDVTLTPLPKMSEYDPEDIYNLADDVSMPIRPNLSREPEWFDRPLKPTKNIPINLDAYRTSAEVPNSPKEQLEDSLMKTKRNEFNLNKKGYYRNYERFYKDMEPIKTKNEFIK